MKKYPSFFAAFLLIFGFGTASQAQCTGVHYRDYMFADSLVQDVVYGSNQDFKGITQSLLLDVYLPASDPNPHNRPLIIWVHSGNFIQGDKSGADVVPLCQSFTKMGYVTASINYRLGMEGVPLPGPDTLAGMRAVIRAMQDCRAAVRYFRKNATAYGIDTSMIFLGGVSAGAIAATHLAYLDQMSEFPFWCDTSKAGIRGGPASNVIEGNSGSLGYSSRVKAVINICGAIGDTSWMHPGATPIISFHGDKDSTVPYNRGRIDFLNEYKLQTVYGGHAMMLRAQNAGLVNCFDQYTGQNHLPEAGNDSVSLAYLDTTLNMTRNFLIHFVCGDLLSCSYKNPLSVPEHELARQSLHCFPNPASDALTVNLSDLKGEAADMRMYNGMGAELRHYSGIRSSECIIERGSLPAGLYFLEVNSGSKRYTARIMFN